MGPGIKGSVNLDRKKRKEKKKYVLIFTNLCLEFNIPFNYRHRQQTKQGWQCLGLVTHRHHRCVYITLLFLGGSFEISTLRLQLLRTSTRSVLMRKPMYYYITVFKSISVITLTND